MAGPWAALQSRGAVREACVGAISNGDYGWSRGRRVCTVQCAVCFARVGDLGVSRPTQRSLLSGARAGFRVDSGWWWEE